MVFLGRYQLEDGNWVTIHRKSGAEKITTARDLGNIDPSLSFHQALLEPGQNKSTTKLGEISVVVMAVVPEHEIQQNVLVKCPSGKNCMVPVRQGLQPGASFPVQILKNLPEEQHTEAYKVSLAKMAKQSKPKKPNMLIKVPPAPVHVPVGVSSSIPQEFPAKLKLKVSAGPNKGGVFKEYALTNTFQISIGNNEECDIVLEDNDVSGTHASICWNWEDDGLLTFDDQESTNGSKVNGTSVKPGSTIVLKPNDKIEMGKSVLVVVMDSDGNDDYETYQIQMNRRTGAFGTQIKNTQFGKNQVAVVLELVRPGGQAFQAGARAGDSILKIGTEHIHSGARAQEILKYSTKDTMRIVMCRGLKMGQRETGQREPLSIDAIGTTIVVKTSDFDGGWKCTGKDGRTWALDVDNNVWVTGGITYDITNALNRLMVSPSIPVSFALADGTLQTLVSDVVSDGVRTVVWNANNSLITWTKRENEATMLVKSFSGAWLTVAIPNGLIPGDMFEIDEFGAIQPQLIKWKLHVDQNVCASHLIASSVAYTMNAESFLRTTTNTVVSNGHTRYVQCFLKVFGFLFFSLFCCEHAANSTNTNRE